ncbi:ATP phosphoribosyltransferase regulatory subunit [Beduini massiliensis]|mgnify:CR=1 FL=1|uniref:ATP phosphoribosyltransferase regulatory subunit n=1 Tax=Beduini massiliensis TaxID=1585974 RepID=UPI00059A894E|nr:ATP phosphoribosyltransferase regulatory subunit [Beduini massiliensis]
MENYKFVLPEEAQEAVKGHVKTLRKMEADLRVVFENLNYDEVMLPTFEYTDLYREISTGIQVDRLFQFFNKDGKAISLRADFTFPLARYHAHVAQMVGRYCYFGKVYRKQLSHKGRQSEIYQAGIELMGLDETAGDQECLTVLAQSLKTMTLSHVQIELGSAAFFSRLKELIKDDGQLKEILDFRDMSAMELFVEKKLKALVIDQKMADFLNQLIILTGRQEVFTQAKKYLEDEALLNALSHLENLYFTFKDQFEDLTVDLAMVPKFKYYTGLMIKGYHLEAAEAFISGGRYDQLLQVFGRKSRAIGLSYHLDMLSELADKEKQND